MDCIYIHCPQRSPFFVRTATMSGKKLLLAAAALSCCALSGLVLYSAQGARRARRSGLLMYTEVPRFELVRDGQLLDQITHTSNNGQLGVSYDEGTMPRGLGGLGICNYMYCPDDYNGVITTASDKSAPSINPHSITWQSWDWDKYGGDTNTYTPSDCITKHLGPGRIQDMPACDD